MFITKSHKKYDTDIMMNDISVHSGVPKQYYYLKSKQFNDWEIPPWELFIFTNKLLGEGSFSKVYLAKWRETFVVAKVINNEFLDAKKFLIEREIDIMSKLHHPNIVQFLGYIDNPFIIVMEYIPNGNLASKIPLLNKQQKVRIMFDILRGLAYLHERLPNSLIHRDIKPTNIILTKSNFAKITDFGLSKFYSIEKTISTNDISKLEQNKRGNEYLELTDVVGTERYMSPEMISNLNSYSQDSNNQDKYTNKIDIYSTGILLYEMFENKKYIPGQKMTWYWCPKKIKNVIINYMLNNNPNERWSALNILKQLNRII